MRALLLSLLLLTSSSAWADWVDPAQTIDLIGTGTASDGIFVVTKEKLKSAQFPNCNFVLKMSPNRPLFDQKLSMLLSAFHSGAKVRFYVTGCDAGNLLMLEGIDILH